MNNQSTTRVSSDKNSYEFPIYQENVEYKFAVQAVNDGGNGPISNFRAVYYCSDGKLKTWVGVYMVRGVLLIVHGMVPVLHVNDFKVDH